MLAISTPTLWGYRNQSRFHTKVSSMNDEDIFGGTWKNLRRSVNISESFLLKSVLIPKINFVTLYTGIEYSVSNLFWKGIALFLEKQRKNVAFPKTLPISMMPYTMGGRLCRCLILHCLPTGLCFGQSSLH